jgi:hypothetical protein
MKKTILLINLFAIFSLNAFSQNTEHTLLKLIYNEIKNQNEYCILRSKFAGIVLTYDPIRGENKIQFSKTIDKKTKDEFEKFSQEEQIKILNCKSSLYNLKDTLTIVDTSNFFSEGYYVFNQNKSVINIIRNKAIKEGINSIFLFAVGIRNNNIIITLSGGKQNGLYNYYFDLSTSNIKIQKNSIIENKATLE